MKLKICLQHPNAKAPTYATDGSACFDLYAAQINGFDNAGDIVYQGYPMMCDTGVAFEVPPGYMLQVRSRSGLAFEHNVEAFHGTIDSDFRGSVQVMLICAVDNEYDPPLQINIGDRIAQACLVPVPRCEFEVVEQLTLTERGTGGFGSTGK